MKAWITFWVTLSLASGTAMACSFDTDCEIGSRCAKRLGELDGVCVGGMSPGNRYDRDPVYERRSKRGYTCSFDTDCDIGQSCVKESGYIDGVCMGR